MQKLFYAIFLLLALGLIYIGLQSGESGGDLETGQQQAGVQDFESPPPSAEDETDGDGLKALEAFQLPRFGDFDNMLDARAIRALVVYSKTSYFLDGVVQRGLSYDSLQEFEKFVNRKFNTGNLKLSVIYLPVTRDQLIPALEAGLGDIAAANLTITPEREKLVDFSRPSMRNVSEILVTSKASKLQPKSLDEMAGLELHVRVSSSYYDSILATNQALLEKNLPPVRLVAVDENLEDEDLLEMVNAGLIPAIVVDSHKATFWSQIFTDILLHKNIKFRSGATIGWAMRKNSPQLKSVVDDFMRKNAAGTLHGNVLLKRYLKNTRYVTNSLQSQEMERFNKTSHLFQKYASRYEFDWLMLVAQAYQESRLDQSARSGSGAVGIMQLLPTTAEDKNVNIGDIHEIENNIHAGVKYLHFIRSRYFEDEDMSEVDKTLFSFASYNAGPARVAQLRREAEKRELDPNVWFGNVEIVAARRIGRETVQYVSNIYKYWLAYQLSVDQIADHSTK
jgi:membrane-bound lytic murein transglycosylase MltF